MIGFVEEGRIEDMLIFATGASAVPHLGFEIPPTIIFNHEVPDDDYTKPYLFANTCAMQLRLPLLDSFEAFSTNLHASLSVKTFTAI